MTAAAFAPKPNPPVVDGIDFNKPITDSPALTSYVLMECGEGFSVEDWKADNTVCCADCGDRYLYNWDYEAIERGDDGEFRCDDCAESVEVEPSYASQNSTYWAYRGSVVG